MRRVVAGRSQLGKMELREGFTRPWRLIEPAREGPEYVFLDEIQYTKDWQTWLKHQVDFHKGRRIAVTGSAAPLVVEGQESGMGRWHTMRLATLSFYEYLQIKKVPTPALPALPSLQRLRTWSEMEFARTAADAKPLTGHFHDYLMRGGFPQCALVDNVVAAQKRLREDTVEEHGGILQLAESVAWRCDHKGRKRLWVDRARVGAGQCMATLEDSGAAGLLLAGQIRNRQPANGLPTAAHRQLQHQRRRQARSAAHGTHLEDGPGGEAVHGCHTETSDPETGCGDEIVVPIQERAQALEEGLAVSEALLPEPSKTPRARRLRGTDAGYRMF